MTLDNHCKEKISIEVIRTLVTKFADFPDEHATNRNAPFHEAFLEAFTDKFDGKVTDTPMLISLSSWLHGLNTTLGQSFFEKTSHILCSGYKKEFKNMLQISTAQQIAISNIIKELKNDERKPNLAEEERLIYLDNTNHNNSISNFTVDCFFDDNETVVAIELKTVKPNSGIFKNEKEKILSAKAGLQNQHPDKKILYFLGFPFDPQSDTKTGYNKDSFMNYSVDCKKFFAIDEILLADELWNFLSGEIDTMQQILDIINEIATPQFMASFRLLTDNSKKQTSDYKEQLLKWNLFSELELVENDSHIQSCIANDKKLQRTYRKIPFDSQGNYQWERFNDLIKLLNN